jgi:hypothetical protein
MDWIEFYSAIFQLHHNHAALLSACEDAWIQMKYLAESVSVLKHFAFFSEHLMQDGMHKPSRPFSLEESSTIFSALLHQDWRMGTFDKTTSPLPYQTKWFDYFSSNISRYLSLN